MEKNPQEGKIILVERTEIDADEYGSFLRITSPDGTDFRIGSKRENLWGIFQNAKPREPILAVFETFTKGKDTITFIADARPITDEILQAGIKKLGENLANATDQQKNRSVGLSYALQYLNDKCKDDDDFIDRAEYIADEFSKFMVSGVKRSEVENANNGIQ